MSFIDCAKSLFFLLVGFCNYGVFFFFFFSPCVLLFFFSFMILALLFFGKRDPGISLSALPLPRAMM